MNTTNKADHNPAQPSSKKFGQLTEDVLFGDIWRRPQLSARERSLVTSGGTGGVVSVGAVLLRATNNGLDAGELEEVITHLAFYSGWPIAASALRILDEQDCGSST